MCLFTDFIDSILIMYLKKRLRYKWTRLQVWWGQNKSDKVHRIWIITESHRRQRKNYFLIGWFELITYEMFTLPNTATHTHTNTHTHTHRNWIILETFIYVLWISPTPGRHNSLQRCPDYSEKDLSHFYCVCMCVFPYWVREQRKYPWPHMALVCD